MKNRHQTTYRSFAHGLVISILMHAAAVAQLPNAWRIVDLSDGSGSTPHYTTSLSTGLQTAAASGGFRYAINARMPSSLPGIPSMIMLYGLGTERFLVRFDLDAAGDLTAALEGGGTYTLTTNSTGSSLYHTHEIIYDATAGTASYLFDGQLKTDTWEPSEPDFASGAIYWGSGNSVGQGTMNFHSVTFEVAGQVEATYDAGTSPASAPDPETQGWTYLVRGTGAASGLSPDEVPIPTIPTASTHVATDLDPYQATLSGLIDQGNLAATVWFEWGTDTTYGETTPPLPLLSDTAPYDFSETITGLQKGVTYHFRCVASNLEGVAYGENQTFTTPDEFSVTSLDDDGPGSLRQHIAAAQPGDTISFAIADTIVLNSQLNISKDLIIAGPGAAVLSVSGNDSSRVFLIGSGATVSISGLTIQNGRGSAGSTGSNGRDGANGRDGGGIYNQGTLTLRNCYIERNRAGMGGGGGRGANGTNLLAGRDGTPGGDAGVGGNGGGIYQHSGSLKLIACTIANNRSGQGGNGGRGGDAYSTSNGDGGRGGNFGGSGHGAGIYIDSGSISMVACTVATNTISGPGLGGEGGEGGSLGTDGPSGGSPFDSQGRGFGGGLYSSGGGTRSITNTTFSGNVADSGGAVYSVGSETMTLSNTLVAPSNSGGSNDIAGSFSVESNLISSIEQLLPLADYGGSTPTMPPLSDSLAIDNGTDSATDLLATDQRGLPRLVGEHVDIGAVEHHPSLVVTTNADSGPGSLREAIKFIGSGGIITFSPSLRGQRITLTSGALRTRQSMTIRGPEAEQLTIDGNGEFGIFVTTGVYGSLTLDSLSLVESLDHAIYLVNSALTLNRCEISRNTGWGISAIIYGRLTLNDSTISGNSAGGIWVRLRTIANNEGSTLTIDNSTISGNSEGGGVRTVASGGQISTATINNSTISGNSAAGSGGGIFSGQSMSMAINNSTISGNSAAGNGGGITSEFGLHLEVQNSIVAGNSASDGADIFGLFSRENSLIGGAPLLAPLGDYGGPTQTMPPLAGSPAIDAGDDPAAAPLATDQRGYPRKSGSRVDIGAVEYQSVDGLQLPLRLRTSLHPLDPGDPGGGGGGGGESADFAFGLTSTSVRNMDFTIVASSDLALPLADWIPIGLMTQKTPGLYQFMENIDSTMFPRRFYRVIVPEGE